MKKPAYEELLDKLEAIRNAGPAFPAWAIATDALRQAGRIPPKWEPNK